MKSIYELTELNEIKNRLDEVISEISKRSKIGSVSQRVMEKYDRFVDNAEQYNRIDSEDLKNVVNEILSFAKHAGFANIQYGLLEDVKIILGLNS